jgi:hypothetical protein
MLLHSLLQDNFTFFYLYSIHNIAKRRSRCIDVKCCHVQIHVWTVLNTERLLTNLANAEVLYFN